MTILVHIVWHSFLWLLWLGSVAAVLTGVGLLFAPGKVARMNEVLSRWIDTADFQKHVDRPRPVDRFVYRHGKIFGPLLFAGSTYVVYKFLLVPIKPRIATLLRRDIYGLFDAFSAYMVICGVIGALIGLIITFRPSILRELEVAVNRWISTDSVLNTFNRRYSSLDRLLVSHPVSAGSFLVGAGLYVMLLLGKVLYSGHWQL